MVPLAHGFLQKKCIQNFLLALLASNQKPKLTRTITKFFLPFLLLLFLGFLPKSSPKISQLLPCWWLTVLHKKVRSKRFFFVSLFSSPNRALSRKKSRNFSRSTYLFFLFLSCSWFGLLLLEPPKFSHFSLVLSLEPKLQGVGNPKLFESLFLSFSP